MCKAPIDPPIMNPKGSNKTAMDWILGIHALLVKGCSEQAEATPIERGSRSELEQPLCLESTHALAWHMRHGDSAKCPLFNPEAARFVRRVYAGLIVGSASVEPTTAIANHLP
jgi:hypothetical protein